MTELQLHNQEIIDIQLLLISISKDIGAMENLTRDQRDGFRRSIFEKFRISDTERIKHDIILQGRKFMCNGATFSKSADLTDDEVLFLKRTPVTNNFNSSLSDKIMNL